MSLRDTAHADLIEIFSDPENVDTCTITSPAGAFENFRVLSNDIHLSIDPGTGETVTGRQCSMAVLISELMAAGFDEIHGVAESDSKPWVVDAIDVNGIPDKFKVMETYPDRGAGLIILILELYKQ
jgi:hypothetical protein